MAAIAEILNTSTQVSGFPVIPGAGNVTVLSNGFDLDAYWAAKRLNPYYKAGKFIERYYAIILTPIGVPCNILTFLIMQRFKPMTSSTFIMMSLAIADSCNLVYNCDVYKIMHFIFSSDAACQAQSTLAALLQYITIWLVMLLTFERLVAVCYPMKASRICTVSNAHRSILVLLIIDGLMSVVHTFAYEKIDYGQLSECEIKPMYGPLMDAWGIVDAVIFVIIPLTFLTLGNISIIVKLRTSRDVDSLTNSTGTNDESNRQNRSVTLMLLAVSITTIVCIGPNAYVGLGGGLTWFFSVSGDVEADARKLFACYTIFCITYANSAVNFFLYVLSGKRFRATFLSMMHALMCRLLKHRYK